MRTLNFTINFDKNCHECGKSGAMKNSLCPSCAGLAIGGKPMKSDAGKMAQERFNKIRRR